MHLKICDTIIMFHAIESLYFDEAACVFVVRTVSGKEYKKPVLDKSEADRIIYQVIP